MICRLRTFILSVLLLFTVCTVGAIDKGNYLFDHIPWAEGRVIEATLRSATSQRVTLRLADGTTCEVECRAGKPSKVKF